MTQHGVLWSTYINITNQSYTVEEKILINETCLGGKNSAQSYPAGEGLATLVADEGSWNKVGIMVALEVHIQKLLLPECFITLATGKRLLPSVCALVHYHMAFLGETTTVL